MFCRFFLFRFGRFRWRGRLWKTRNTQTCHGFSGLCFAARRQSQNRKFQKAAKTDLAYKYVLTVFPVRFRPFPMGGRFRARLRWVQAGPSPGPRSAQSPDEQFCIDGSFACLFRLCLRNHFHQEATFWQIMLNLCRQRFLVVRLAGQLENTFLEFWIKFAKKCILPKTTLQNTAKPHTPNACANKSAIRALG